MNAPGHVHHVCHLCGHVTEFDYRAIGSIAPSWTCTCGLHIQMERLPAVAFPARGVVSPATKGE